uniref:Uncharacterized protein n=1 Tax=Romanomermis culicivorax TaxID=13658 RepID=A0A915KV34_ROMCU
MHKRHQKNCIGKGSGPYFKANTRKDVTAYLKKLYAERSGCANVDQKEQTQLTTTDLTRCMTLPDRTNVRTSFSSLSSFAVLSTGVCGEINVLSSNWASDKFNRVWSE